VILALYATERIAAGWIATGKWRVHALVEWSLCPALMEPKEPPGVGASFFSSGPNGDWFRKHADHASPGTWT
jgi:hypothetical protein